MGGIVAYFLVMIFPLIKKNDARWGFNEPENTFTPVIMTCALCMERNVEWGTAILPFDSGESPSQADFISNVFHNKVENGYY